MPPSGLESDYLESSVTTGNMSEIFFDQRQFAAKFPVEDVSLFMFAEEMFCSVPYSKHPKSVN